MLDGSNTARDHQNDAGIGTTIVRLYGVIPRVEQRDF
jgi:hypothetical protein